MAGDVFFDTAKMLNGIKQQGSREWIQSIKIDGTVISEGEHYRMFKLE